MSTSSGSNCNVGTSKSNDNSNSNDSGGDVNNNIELFKQPPPQHGDCPICIIRIPTLHTGSKYKPCCGKVICSGCIYAPLYDNQGNKVDNQKCPFCRTPTPIDDEVNDMLKKRIEAGDSQAMYNQGCGHRDGIHGCPQDYGKGLELWHRAGELGYSAAHTAIGNAYYYGVGVEVDKEKAKHYYELAAIGGCVIARYNLGCFEKKAGNLDRALRHFMIAARSGHGKSLKQIKRLCTNGHVTDEDYTEALQSYQEYLGEIKSRQRDEAAAARGELYRYY